MGKNKDKAAMRAKKKARKKALKLGANLDDSSIAIKVAKDRANAIVVKAHEKVAATRAIDFHYRNITAGGKIHHKTFYNTRLMKKVDKDIHENYEYSLNCIDKNNLKDLIFKACVSHNIKLIQKLWLDLDKFINSNIFNSKIHGFQKDCLEVLTAIYNRRKEHRITWWGIKLFANRQLGLNIPVQK